MIMTELYDGQGLGNQLWVYCACRSIADQLGYPYSILSPQRFKGADFLDVSFGINPPTVTAPLRVFRERMFFDPDLDYVSSAFDDSVRSLPVNTRIEGLFQSERYFFGHSEGCSRYIGIKPEALALCPVPPDLCILNIRGGEYKRHRSLILPKSYWVKAMHNMREIAGVERFMIVTDDPRYAKSLFPKIPVLEGGIAECYMALYRASLLVLSNSSFAYFPTKTSSNKRCVIAPKYWARFGNRYSRWASPANLYGNWLWQDRQGLLSSYEQCLDEQIATEHYYTGQYSVQVPPWFVNRAGLRRFLPGKLRKHMKNVLSLFFPKHFG